MAEQIPEYQASQQVQTGSMQDIGGSMSHFADSNNWLGQLGARATMNGSVSIMKAMGYQAGMNPHGDALPAITKADEAYVNAYNQQSQMTLSTQANELRMQAQTELAKAYKLTPELVMQYEETVGQGLEKIASMAPREVAQELRFKMANSMINDSALLNQKMVNQNKQDTFDLWKYSKAQDLRSIFDTGVSGDSAVAHALYEKQLDDNAANRATGLITAEQERAANDAARKTYLNGKYTGLAMQARSEGREAEFLADFGENKPKELTFEEWPSVAQSIASYTANLDKLQSEQRQVKSSEYLLKLTENPLAVTDTDLSELKGILTPTQMNNLAAKTIVAQRKAMNDMAKQQVNINGFSDVDAFSEMSAKDKNSAFHALVDQKMQAAKDNGDVLEEFDAETLVAGGAAGEVPAFTKKLRARLTSGNAQLMNQAIVAFDRIYRTNGAPENVSSVANDTEAMAMASVFKSQLESGNPPDIAAVNAKAAVFGKTAERLKYLEQSYADYIKANRSKGDTAATTAMRLVGLGGKVPFANASALGYRLNNMLRANYIATDGDIPAAIEMTQQTVERSYGETEFNGRKEVVYMPLEARTKIPPEAKGVIQHDAYRQMRIQLQSMKDQYDEGMVDSWIEVPETPEIESMLALTREPAYQAYLKKKSLKGMDLQQMAEFAKLDDRIRKYIAGGDMQVTRHNRNKPSETLNIGIVAMDTLQTVNDGKTIGGYEVVEKTPLGFRSLAITNGLSNVVAYVPNPTQLQEDYAGLLVARAGEDPREIMLRLYRQREAKKMRGSPNPLFTFYRGADTQPQGGASE